MIHVRNMIGIALLAVPWIALPQVARADRSTAEFFAERGEKALDEKNWEEAETFYRRALEEDETFLPARYGLAEALLGAQSREVAIQELRRFCTEATAMEDLPSGWKKTLGNAQRLLTRIDTLGTQYRELVDDHIAKLVKFASKWMKKDPRMALEAVTSALALDPDCERAKELRAELRSEISTGGDPIFNGRDLSGWAAMKAPIWQVEDGILICRAVDAGYQSRTEIPYKGDYDVIMEARMVEASGRTPYFAIVGAMSDVRNRTAVGFFKDSVTVLLYRNALQPDFAAEILPRNMKSPYDQGDWNVYELRFRGDRIHAVVNGQEIKVVAREEGKVGGFLGVFAQDCTLAVKRVEVLRR